MTSKPSTFFINRFVITKGSKAVYHGIFHQGVNIIRGANSVGKSTILDFLFYALGGDVAEDRWNEEAQTCDGVFAEIELNSHVLTVHRRVQPGKKPP
ncbi:AAA family ATPase [Pseudomonas aeruginosa]|nr:AAA family ATPase [Pseudomonas aeruginosa]MDI3648340.1 AAA family ATPase [Pseudomonas aeruginosa]MDI3793319.1 AAA family ATPase [Pseudomonas aeruginosa]WRH80176.1 AAA family ATPase [Pseudomonas aeruginosa]